MFIFSIKNETKNHIIFHIEKKIQTNCNLFTLYCTILIQRKFILNVSNWVIHRFYFIDSINSLLIAYLQIIFTLQYNHCAPIFFCCSIFLFWNKLYMKLIKNQFAAIYYYQVQNIFVRKRKSGRCL